ncbi:MAG: SGNH/GDSL hydrolase family protein [Puniceicoccales bacterium]
MKSLYCSLHSFRNYLRVLLFVPFFFGSSSLQSQSLEAVETITTSAPSVRSFHEKALKQEPVSVVFFGGSLTWGANSSDPLKTSYRGRMMQWLREMYPNTPITFHDAAIGGTGSELGLFRLERDVLAYNPDLVFLDFTVNDSDKLMENAEQMASYEQLVQEMVSRDIPVIQVLMMFKWHGTQEDINKPATERHAAHTELGEAYGVPVVDVVPYVRTKVQGGVPIEEIWALDGAHPVDLGYQYFFETVRDRYLEAIEEGTIQTLPEEPLYGNRYPVRTREILVESELPEGWTQEITYRTSLWFDGLSSRWMTDVACASKAANSGPLEVEFTGSMVGIFGEQNGYTPDIEVYIDGERIQPPKAKEGEYAWPMGTDRFAPPSSNASNLFFWKKLAANLEDGPHTLKIVPLWEGADPNAELRIESICSAGN